MTQDTLSDLCLQQNTEIVECIDCPSPILHRECAPQLAPQEIKKVAQLFAKTAVMLDGPGFAKNQVQGMRIIGQWIRAQRKKRGLSRTELAQRMGLDLDFLLHLETGILTPKDIMFYLLKRFTKGNQHSQIKIQEDAQGSYENTFDIISLDTYRNMKPNYEPLEIERKQK